MKRMVLLLTVPAIMEVMVVASAIPAMAAVPVWCSSDFIYDPSCDQNPEGPVWCLYNFVYDPSCDQRAY